MIGSDPKQDSSTPRSSTENRRSASPPLHCSALRHPDLSLYHAGGLDCLAGAVKWTAHPSVQGDYIASDLFLVRDHLGSVVMTLKAEKTCLMWSDPGPGEGDPVCVQSVYRLTPQEAMG